MNEPKSAQAWIEPVTYVECPYCDHCHSLGDTLADQNFELNCENCLETFLVLKVRNE